MDPKACLELAADSVRDNDKESARTHLRQYALWRNNGGFQPTGGDEDWYEIKEWFQRKFLRPYGGPEPF